MVKPISLRLRNAEILAQAHAALGRGRQQELRQAHNAGVMVRARGIVAQAKEQDRQRRRGKLADDDPPHMTRGKSVQTTGTTSGIGPDHDCWPV